MEVTFVKITLEKEKQEGIPQRLKGYAKVTLDKELVISSIKIIENGDRRHIVFPERRIDPSVSQGEFITIPYVNPVTQELRKHITDAVFEAYDRIKAEQLARQQES